MATMTATTTSDSAAIKPGTESSLREYIDRHHLGNVSAAIADGEVSLSGGDMFVVYGTTEHGDPAHDDPIVTREFLDGLGAFFRDRAELNIVSLGFTGRRHDEWSAIRYRVTTDGVGVSTLDKPTVERNEDGDDE